MVENQRDKERKHRERERFSKAQTSICVSPWCVTSSGESPAVTQHTHTHTAGSDDSYLKDRKRGEQTVNVSLWGFMCSDVSHDDPPHVICLSAAQLSMSALYIQLNCDFKAPPGRTNRANSFTICSSG